MPEAKLDYKEKYYFTFVGLDGAEYRCEIYEKRIGEIVAIEIRAGVDPFVITYPQFSLFEPVRGSGCKINLLSETDRQFYELYTPNFLKYQIKFKKNGTVHWCGFLDSELYSEPFNIIDNYIVSFTGTDGLALLDRLYYVTDEGDYFTGITSQWNIITTILDKLEITFNALFVAVSTTSDEISVGTGETIFHQTFVRNANYYDEDDNPFTCRKVLEEILKPYGASLTISNNVIYINDIHSILSTGTTEIIKYGNTWQYWDTMNLSMNLGDLSTIGFAGNSQTLNIVSGINKQVVSYSPYRLNELINFDAEKDFSGTGVTTQFGTTNYRWEETTFENSESWTATNNGRFCSMQGLDGENESVQDYYLDITPYGFCISGNTSQKSFVYKMQIPYLIQNDYYRIKIEMSAYPRMADDLNNPDTPYINEIRWFNLICRLQVGDYKYYQNWLADTPQIGYWVLASEEPVKDLILHFNDRTTPTEFSALEDKWTDLKMNVFAYYGSGIDDDRVYREDFFIPLTYHANGGEMIFEIYGFTPLDFNGYDVENYVAIEDLRIKDIKISIIDSKGNTIETNDREFTGYLNPLFKNQGDKITITSGTNEDEHPLERGAILAFDGVDTYTNVQTWTKASATDNIENLLLRSVESNYENPAVEITATINIISDIVGYLTYSNYLTQQFMITSCEHNFAGATTLLTMQAVIADNLTIEKNY